MGPNDILHLGFASNPVRLRPVLGVGTTEPTERGGRVSSSTSAIERVRPADKAEFSPEALRAAEENPALTTDAEAPASSATSVGTPNELSDEEQREVQELVRRDREVRTHEQAHKAAAGPYGGAISYEFETGPDGKRYATGGSVPIDVSPVAGDPRATIQKMRQVRGAALAPAEPSSADRQVAALAQRQLGEAQRELAAQKRDELSGEGANSNAAPAPGGSTAPEPSTAPVASNAAEGRPSSEVGSTPESNGASSSAVGANGPSPSANSAVDTATADARRSAPLAAYGRSGEAVAPRHASRSSTFGADRRSGLIDVRG